MSAADSTGKPVAASGAFALAEKKALVTDLLQAAVDAVNPLVAVKRHVRREGNTLLVGDRRYDLAAFRQVVVVGGGKATAPMAQAIEEIMGDRLAAGLVNVKYGNAAPTRIVEINQAGHPIPDDKGQQGALRMLQLVEGSSERDLVICLLSGGGSALLTAPTEGITLADKRRLTDALLRSGATINELNVVRKHISRIKGGYLARAAYPATVVSLILSDVIGDPLDVIASGPTVADSSTFANAWDVLERHDLIDKVPQSIANHLRSGTEGTLGETPKEGDPALERTHNVVIGSNKIAARAAIERARGRGLNALLLTTFLEGEAREVGITLAAIGREVAHSGHPIARPACIVASGETTVTVRGQGRGGRNQELVLSAALKLDGLPDVVVAATTTDGTDGPTDAAGAIATGETIRRAREKGLDARRALRDNDSFPLFESLGDLIATGPTNTNVNDLAFVLVL